MRGALPSVRRIETGRPPRPEPASRLAERAAFQIAGVRSKYAEDNDWPATSTEQTRSGDGPAWLTETRQGDAAR